MEESNLEDKKNNSDSIIENSHLNQRNLASSFNCLPINHPHPETVQISLQPRLSPLYDALQESECNFCKLNNDQSPTSAL